MEIETKNAADHFFPNSAYNQVYSEAVTNALDAGATEISIAVSIRAFSEPKTILVTISDNGTGFTDESFERFKRLLNPRDESHKGLGRLVYLQYFQTVEVRSIFNNKERTFVFTSSFNGQSELKDTSANSPVETTLIFRSFRGDRIKSYDDIKATAIKEQLMLELLPRLYEMQQQGRQIRISIKVETEQENRDKGFFNDQQTLTLNELPKLIEETIQDPTLDLLQEIKMSYAIKSELGEDTTITAICVDGRTLDLKLIPANRLPRNYSAIFLFSSPFFTGKTDTSRQKLDFKDASIEELLRLSLRKHVAAAIAKEIPAIGKRNADTKREFEQRYPHLLGYFEGETIGLINHDEAIDIAQKRFFRDQKAILECDHLDDAAYKKTLEVSSRTLTEYILYRNLIIGKLREKNASSPEKEIHDLIVPQHSIVRDRDFLQEIYRTNAWLLDDKFMTFTTILSEAEMGKVIEEITLKEGPERDATRPDISMIFSADPKGGDKVDVVIVEVKRKQDDEADNFTSVLQLTQRASKLVKTCPNIQRMWYYGIIDINEALEERLGQFEFIPLFSKGKVFYREFPTKKSDGTIVPSPVFLLSYDALIADADARNSTFLTILRQTIKSRMASEDQSVPIENAPLVDSSSSASVVPTILSKDS